MKDRLFIGVFPCGLVYADRTREVHGDYKRLAFLQYSTLELELEKDCPADLASRIRTHALELQSKPGTAFQISSCNQTVLLGSALQPEARP